MLCEQRVDKYLPHFIHGVYNNRMSLAVGSKVF